MSARRPIAKITVNEELDYEVEELLAIFDDVVTDVSPGLDIEIWNLCLYYIHVIYNALSARDIIPENDDVEDVLRKAMFHGYNIARSVERAALRRSGIYR